MASVTLSEFRSRSRERSDMENSRFISDAELDRYINASIQELYDLLIQTRGENYYIDSYTFSTVNGQDTYALPNDFLKLMGVDYIVSPTRSYTLRAFRWQERNRFRDPYYLGYNANLMYQIRGNNLVFTPIPNNNQSMILWYIPRATLLVDPTDAYDGINGWEEYVIIDASIKMRVKEESPVEELLLAKREMKDRIIAASAGRDSTDPPRVVDVQAMGTGWGRSWN